MSVKPYAAASPPEVSDRWFQRLRPGSAASADRRPEPLEPAVADLGGLAAAYGFTDTDGSQPDVWSVIGDA